MRYVILRDDDTNALTPPHCLERLYRPFLDRGLPVHLATIPEVNVNTRMPDGGRRDTWSRATGKRRRRCPSAPIPNWWVTCAGIPATTSSSMAAITIIWSSIAWNRAEAARRIERGAQVLTEAGFGRPRTFVAPYDKLSRGSVEAVAARFGVLSTGWFEWGRLPFSWWPRFAVKKITKADHWRIGRTRLLSHPGCLLSCQRPRQSILDTIKRRVESRPLTVLVTHWWEYFRDGRPDEPLIDVLHQTADYLGRQCDVKTILFDDVAKEPAPRW